MCIKTTKEHSRKDVTPVKAFSKVLKITASWMFFIVLVSGFKNQRFQKHFREFVFFIKKGLLFYE